MQQSIDIQFVQSAYHIAKTAREKKDVRVTNLIENIIGIRYVTR